MRVIGFDPGLSATGFGVIESDGKNNVYHIDNGVLRPPRRMSLPDRLNYLYKKGIELLKSYSPEVLAIEDTFYHKNIKSAMSLGQARGTLLLVGAHMGIPCIEYAPRKVKMSVVGNGAASKEQVNYMICKLLKLPEGNIPTDASDALAIALCYIHQNRFN